MTNINDIFVFEAVDYHTFKVAQRVMDAAIVNVGDQFTYTEVGHNGKYVAIFWRMSMPKCERDSWVKKNYGAEDGPTIISAMNLNTSCSLSLA